MGKIEDLIKENNFKFKKSLGQNFLIDQNILKKIVTEAEINEDTLVIEVGVGAGSLTKELACSSKQVLGYEIDKSLEPILKETLKEYSNIDIVYDDFLKRDIANDLKKYQYKNLYVVANLPYYITTPILNKIIDSKISIDKIVVMVQKEVGDRINAKPNSKDYNSLTIFLNYYFDIKKLFNVSKNVFVPRPNVDSIVIELSNNHHCYHVIDEDIFFKLIRESFKYKRKNLRNNLKEYKLDIIEDTLKQENLDLTVRAEQLTLDQFIKIANAIKLSK